MRLFWVVLLGICSLFGASAPATSAQEATPPTPTAVTTIEPSLIPPQILEAINSALDLCDNCARNDFFPLIHANGTLDDHIVVYWPRDHAGTFDIGTPDIMLGYNPDVNGLEPLTIGSHEILWGLISTNGNPDELLASTASIDELKALGDPPYRRDFCNVCGNTEFFPYVIPVGERIAYTFADGTNAITIPDSIALMAWDGDTLKLYYGAGTIANLPYAHIWWEVGLSG